MLFLRFNLTLKRGIPPITKKALYFFLKKSIYIPAALSIYILIVLLHTQIALHNNTYIYIINNKNKNKIIDLNTKKKLKASLINMISIKKNTMHTETTKTDLTPYSLIVENKNGTILLNHTFLKTKPFIIEYKIYHKKNTKYFFPIAIYSPAREELIQISLEYYLSKEEKEILLRLK